MSESPAASSHGRPAVEEIPISVVPSEGWHCGHYFYRFDRARIAEMSACERRSAHAAFVEIFCGDFHDRPERNQSSIVSGHKADFAVMAMDPDPLKVDSVHQRLLASPLGVAIEPTYSFVSISEISEYVPSVEEYGARLVAGGEEKGFARLRGKISGLRATRADDEKAASLSRIPGVARDLLLSHEQEAQSRRELVHAPIRRPVTS